MMFSMQLEHFICMYYHTHQTIHNKLQVTLYKSYLNSVEQDEKQSFPITCTLSI